MPAKTRQEQVTNQENKQDDPSELSPLTGNQPVDSFGQRATTSAVTGLVLWATCSAATH